MDGRQITRLLVAIVLLSVGFDASAQGSLGEAHFGGEATLDAPAASWTGWVGDPAHTAFFVQNTGAAPAHVEWVSLNGRTVFGGSSEIQAEIDAIPPEADGSDATRVFRFVTGNRRHAHQLTTAFEWFLSPTLFFNSSGVAHCGEAAEQVNMLATERGLSAREWGLSGHIVAEVQVGARWQMYDADWGVYFLTRDGEIASVADLEADPTLITDPVLRLETPGFNPYQALYAEVFASADDNWIRRTTPRATRPPRPLVVMLPRGGSLRFPGHFASAPLDYRGLPITRADWSNLVLRLPTGTSGEIDNPFIVRTLRGSGLVSLAGQVFEIGSAEMQAFIDARTDPLETMELLEARTAVDVVYLLNPVRWSVGSVNTLALQTRNGTALELRRKPTGDPSGDRDGDGIPDDGDASGIVGDAPCAHADTTGCDDNCLAQANASQLDADGSGSGNRCDADFDQDELITIADVAVMDLCVAGGAPADDPLCVESDLDESGHVDASDGALLNRLRPRARCGLGFELLLPLVLLAAWRRKHDGPRRSR